jgi:DNA-directed RNA polymerase subunit RPC12/RpoP
MKAVVVRCPECNATLEAGAEAREVRCSYCGTLATVQRRTRFLQRPAALPPTGGDAPSLPVAVQPVAVAVPAIIAGVALLVVLGVIFALARAPKPGGPMLLADANGDGTEDVVAEVRVRSFSSEVNLVAAFDGRTGKELWRSDELWRGTGLLCVSGDVVLLSASGPVLRGLGLADGKPRFEVKLEEKVSHLCEGPDPQTVNVITADKRGQPLTLTDGRLGPAGSPRLCRPLRCDQRSAGMFNEEWANRDRRSLRRSIRLPGMVVERVIVQGGVTLALGGKSPGTRVPMLASIRESEPRPGDFAGSGPQVLWQATAPAENPLSASSGLDPYEVALDDTLVALSYQGGGGHRLTAFTLADGKRRFDVDLPGMRDVWSVLIGGGRVYVSSSWGFISAHDAGTGETIFTKD